MKDEALKLFRSSNREHLHFLWEKAKNNDLEDLNDEERHMAEAMLLHEDEFLIYLNSPMFCMTGNLIRTPMLTRFFI